VEGLARSGESAGQILILVSIYPSVAHSHFEAADHMYARMRTQIYLGNAGKRF